MDKHRYVTSNIRMLLRQNPNNHNQPPQISTDLLPKATLHQRPIDRLIIASGLTDQPPNSLHRRQPTTLTTIHRRLHHRQSPYCHPSSTPPSLTTSSTSIIDAAIDDHLIAVHRRCCHQWSPHRQLTVIFTVSFHRHSSSTYPPKLRPRPTTTLTPPYACYVLSLIKIKRVLLHQ